MKLTAMAAMLLLFTGSVIADDNAHKWSVGGSLSYSDYETDEGSISDGAAGFKAHAQYRLKTWASLEGAFYISPDFKGDLTPDKAGGETETSFQGITFHGIAYLPSP
ncbi:MAG: hypothetical protein QGG54_18320, partial [Gammaproteobacteria bacterium]|nr:hypothetical protein [Gammaproteobacteria bacterium]